MPISDSASESKLDILLRKFEGIEVKLGKLDSIKTSIDSFGTRLESLDARIITQATGVGCFGYPAPGFAGRGKPPIP